MHIYQLEIAEMDQVNPAYQFCDLSDSVYRITYCNIITFFNGQPSD